MIYSIFRFEHNKLTMPQAWEHRATSKKLWRTLLQSKNYSQVEMKFINTVYPQDNPSQQVGFYFHFDLNKSIYLNLFQGSLSHSMKRLIARSKATGTLRGYTSTISSWMDFAEANNLKTNPANPFGVAKYITELAVAGISFSLLSKISPALTYLHEGQNHNTLPAVQNPFVKLVLSGAKREAAERKEPIKKAQVLSQGQIHQIVDLLWKKGVGVIDKELLGEQWSAFT